MFLRLFVFRNAFCRRISKETIERVQNYLQLIYCADKSTMAQG
jgi:hypothetical protein